MEIDDVIEWMNFEREEATGRPYTATTQASARSRLRSAMAALGTDEVSVLASILPDSAAVKRLLVKMRAGHERSTVQQVHWALKHLHAYAVAVGAISGSFDVKAPARGQRQPMNVYSQDQVGQLVEAARGRSLRWWAFLATIAHTGQRVGEVLDLRWSMLMLSDPPAYFDLQRTKTGRQMHVPLDSYLREQVFTDGNVAALKAQPRGRFNRDPAIYPFPWSYNCAQKQLRRHCDLVGVPYYGFHRFRHTFATRWMPDIGVVAVSRLLGHARIETTASLYDHTTGRDYGPLLG